MSKAIVPSAPIENKILLLRGERVMLDADLATLYGVDVRVLNQAVKRNLERFPADFMFQLSTEEVESLRSQVVILKKGRGIHRKYAPYAFTEHGVAMLSAVLRSPQAIQVSIQIVRSFIELRRTVALNADLGRKLASLEKKYDGQFRIVFDALRDLMAPPAKPKRRIGFKSD